MCDAFSRLHPIINFTYFTAVILFSMFFMHPAFLVISLICSFIYSVYLGGSKAVKFNLLSSLCIGLAIAILNPVFVHQGVTTLFFFNDHGITLESMAFGVGAGIMFVSVLIWFSCYHKVMTSDKFMYLFGRIIPALSLVLSMTLRFVPKFKAQLKVVEEGQKSIGRGASQGTIFSMIRNGVKVISIMITWALENGIETSDSMKARGYGLKGRTSFSLYRFDSRDKKCLIYITLNILIILIGAYLGFNTIMFFPMIKYKSISIVSVLFYISYTLLCIFPVIVNVREDMVWKRLRSTI
ncbi:MULTISPECIES: energy-coupling factor transporter transmembrane component T [Clostridiaceae]|uniref:energy-coupling factor transporter transmembrane component T n=1 Tax=Clostridiaceae TaxID=31979 RepID=UPI00055362B3|nr:MULTISPECIES: energy-coupling factor transporter transmembrane component T [Clostridiaceae]